MLKHNLIEHSSNYSETTGSLLPYSKDEGNNFNADIANDDNFSSKYFKHKAKLFGNTISPTALKAANGILKNTTIAVPLKFLSILWRSLELPLINCKVKLKLKWTKYRVFSVGCNGILNNSDSDRIVLTIKDTELYVPVVTLSARDKGFER